MQAQILSSEPLSIDKEDFSCLLRYYNLEYKPTDQYYLQVGEIKIVQGWILHISIIKLQLLELLMVLVPELAHEKVPFKIINNIDTASALLNGQLGYLQLGKIVRIYPEDDERAVYLAKKLIALTLPFRGPEIPTDVYLGGTIYTRYGSFNPIMQHDAIGLVERYIHNYKGQLVKDEDCIPFKMPDHIQWPFASITKPVPAKVNGYLSVLNDTFVVTSIIKGDSKGNVFRTLRMKGLWFQWCLVKEAKHDMAVDEVGRDIQERLHWQLKLQKALHKNLPVPQAYDIFKENGNTYLVMEYVEGQSLYEITNNIYEGNSWSNLDLPKKLLLLDHLLQLISYLEILHREGYVHRDFILENFIMDKHNRLVMIDMELAYSLREEYPDPPFALGTVGFMSPEQWNVSTPTIKEDVYALGAMMISLLTNFLPEKFGTGDLKKLEENIAFFIGDKTMAKLITQCLQPKPHTRPELQEIKTLVQKYRAKLKKPLINSPSQVCKRIDTQSIKQIIHDSLLSLNTPAMGGLEKLWFSNSIKGDQFIGNQQNSHNYYMGLHTGISGVIYMLACAKNAGFSVSDVLPVMLRNYDYLQHKFLLTLPNVPSGLYFGAAGLAVGLNEGLRSGLIDDPTATIKASILTCLQLPGNGPGIATGIAGQGLATLQCLPYLEANNAITLLQQQVTALLDTQQKDGSWIWNDEKTTGFSNGTAGITIFLLEYYRRFNDESVKSAIEKALKWIRSKAIKQKSNFSWAISNKKRMASPWLSDGFTGIALCFIRAYELFKDPVYQQLAEKALFNHPSHIVHSNLSLAQGMSGLGKVYMEAARAFKAEIWLERADWIAQVLVHTGCYQSDGSYYWVIENITTPTADLMVGNSGIINFLIQYNIPNRLGVPLIM